MTQFNDTKRAELCVVLMNGQVFHKPLDRCEIRSQHVFGNIGQFSVQAKKTVVRFPVIQTFLLCSQIFIGGCSITSTAYAVEQTPIRVVQLNPVDVVRANSTFNDSASPQLTYQQPRGGDGVSHQISAHGAAFSQPMPEYSATDKTDNANHGLHSDDANQVVHSDSFGIFDLITFVVLFYFGYWFSKPDSWFGRWLQRRFARQYIRWCQEVAARNPNLKSHSEESIRLAQEKLRENQSSRSVGK